MKTFPLTHYRTQVLLKTESQWMYMYHSLANDLAGVLYISGCLKIGHSRPLFFNFAQNVMSRHLPIAFPAWDPAVDQGKFGSSLHGMKVLACERGRHASAKPATVVSANHYIEHTPWGSSNDNSVNVKFDGHVHSTRVSAKHVWPVINGTESGDAVNLAALGGSDTEAANERAMQMQILLKNAKEHIKSLCGEKERLLADMTAITNENMDLKVALLKSRQDGITQSEQLVAADAKMALMQKRSMELEKAAVAAQQMLQDETNPIPRR